MYFGNPCQTAVLSTVMSPLVPRVPPSPAIKQFLPFPLDTTTAVNLFPNFSMVDRVQKSVINDTFGAPPSPKRKRVVACGVCQLRFNSQIQATAHYKGTKHAKKLRALETPKGRKQSHSATKRRANQEQPKSTNLTAVSSSSHRTGITVRTVFIPPPPSDMGASALACDHTKRSQTSRVEETWLAPRPSVAGESQGETEEEKAKRLLYCSLCKVSVNSASQLEAHSSGTKHKTMLQAKTGCGAIKSFPRLGLRGKLAPTAAAATGLQNKTFHCEPCNVHVNSETQLKQHISSRRHKDRVAGKPPKPKYSPYIKSQRLPSTTSVKSLLEKDLGPPLAVSILPTHLAAVAGARATPLPQFALRSNPVASLFQGQPFPAALLGSGLGPIRTSPAPVLYASY